MSPTTRRCGFSRASHRTPPPPMADEERHMTEIPGEPLEYFLYQRCPCVIYEENGVRKAARFEPPDRFYPMDPWILDWGDIAGLAYPQPISEYSFALYVALDRQDYEAEKKEGTGSRGTESPE
jgi:hypothetical protein